MKVAIITAGGAGMFCGSCMQDNTLAQALRDAGHDVTLIPTYTPITVDDDSLSTDRVFLGGINVYLDSAVPGWAKLPRFLKGWLDRPSVLRWLTRRSSATDAAQLGWLTVDMLKGTHGPQRDEIRPLINWLVDDLQPDLILFSNALLSGIVPELRERYAGPIACLLQGDDIFLDALPGRWKQTAVDLVRDGYFARVCPEKGIDRFLQAAARLADQDERLRFVIAGYLPDLHAKWFHQQLSRTQQTVGADRLQWLGSPATRTAKFQILQTFDVLCVPSAYREPKGIFVLEAALAGVPALLPHHGAFPERIACLDGGWTWPPDDEAAMDRALLESIERIDAGMAERLQQSVAQHCSTDVTGPVISDVLQTLVPEHGSQQESAPL